MNLIDQNDVVDLVTLFMINLGLYEKLEAVIKDANPRQETRGQKSFTTCKLIWKFYHENATPSTITSCPAKLKVSE